MPAWARAQAPVLHGIVIDAETHQPVPFAQLGVGQNQIGTSTNVEGRFALPVPVRYQQSTLEVAVIGYQKYRRPLPPLPGPELRIELRPAPAQLGEVAVSASVLGLIREGVRRIPQNYAVRPTRLEGFFRESDNELANGTYHYLAEATLTAFKAPYTRPGDDGAIVIRQSRKVDLQEGKAVLRRRWLAGPFIPHRFDFVHKRLDFINENTFKDYEYKIADLTTYDGHPVYVIAFGPKPGSDRADFEGRLYLDQNTYAFLAAEWHRTPGGLRRELISFDAEERAYRVDYQQFGGRWYLKSVWYNTRGEGLGSEKIRHLAEFLTTTIDTTAGPPPGYTERAQFRDVFLENPVRYDSAFWQNHTTLLPPEQLRTALRDQERQLAAEQLFAPKKPEPLPPGKRAMLAVLRRLRVSVPGVGLLPLAGEAAEVQVAFAPPGSSFQLSAQRRTPSPSVSWLYGSTIQLDLTRHVAVYYQSQQVHRQFQGLGWEIGATGELNLRPRHRPVFVRAGFGFRRQRVGYALGTFANDDRDLRVAGKNLSAKRVAVALQNLSDAWTPKVGLGLELSHRLELAADVSYLLPIRTAAELHLEEKSGFFLTRKQADAALPRAGATVLVNGVAGAAPPWRLGRALFSLNLLYRFF